MRSPLARLSLAGIGCSIALVPTRALAEEEAAEGPRVVLTWSAPMECPGAEAVRRRIESLVGPGTSVEARAVVTRDGGAYQVAIEVRAAGTAGERRLTAPTCDDAAESVAAVLALAATSAAPPPPPSTSAPNALAVAPALAPAAPLAPAPAPAPTPTPASKPQRAALQPPRAHLRLAVDAALDLGTEPGPAPGADLRGEINVGRVSAGLSGTLWLDRDGHLATSTTQGAHFALQSYDAFGYYELARAGSLEIAPGVLAEVAAMSASGFGASISKAPSAVWPSLGAGVRARWVFGRSRSDRKAPEFSVALGLQAVVPLVPQRFHIDGTPNGLVFAVAPVTGRAEMGPEVRF